LALHRDVVFDAMLFRTGNNTNWNSQPVIRDWTVAIDPHCWKAQRQQLTPSWTKYIPAAEPEEAILQLLCYWTYFRKLWTRRVTTGLFRTENTIIEFENTIIEHYCRVQNVAILLRLTREQSVEHWRNVGRSNGGRSITSRAPNLRKPHTRRLKIFVKKKLKGVPRFRNIHNEVKILAIPN
jgi:hypothetical protein